MLNKVRRAWVQTVCRDPSFTLPLGVAGVVVFLPTLVVLLIEWRFKTFDLFPGSQLLLPSCIAITLIFLALGLVMTFYAIRGLAYPGSLLYRLTHSTPRHPG